MTFDVPALFAAGLLTFLSPCILPLVPIYAATLAGTTVAELRAGRSVRRRALFATTSFAAGLALVFVLLGATATSLARVLGSHRHEIAWTSAGLLALFGLRALGVLRWRWLERTAQPLLGRFGAGGSAAASFLFGAAFALGWTPCVGPVLGSVLTYAASASSSPLRGAGYLAVYAAGLVAPLFAAALFAPAALRLLDQLKVHLRKLELASGALLLGAAAYVAHGALSARAPATSGTSLASQAAPFPGELATPAAPPGACSASSGCDVPGLATAATAPDAPPPSPPRMSSAGPRMVEFVSTSCPVCHAMEPVVRELEQACDALPLERRVVDAPGGADAAIQFGIRAVPTFVVLGPDGRELQRLLGMQPISALRAAAEAASGAACSG